MRLLPRELDKLTLHTVGLLAQKRLARGVRLNVVEATALIASQVLEYLSHSFLYSRLIRDGNHTVAELMSVGRQMLGIRHVQDGVAALLHDVQVEGTFLDGTKLVTIHDPICTESGDLTLALRGSFLPIPSEDLFPVTAPSNLTAGEIFTLPGSIKINVGKDRTLLLVTNHGDRPIQIGSHYPFIESNACLEFDRLLAYGKRLDIAAGTAVRFEPGDQKYVNLVSIAGTREVYGGNGIASGCIDDSSGQSELILSRLASRGFMNKLQTISDEEMHLYKIAPFEMQRALYARSYGPTTGDRIRLGDANIVGDEIVFGGGKVIREGMGQSTGISDADALDLVITNAVILDWTGIYKADIGIKGGYICGIGKAGNRHIMDISNRSMIVGSGASECVTTEVIAGEGCIITAGAIDSHIHFICPQLCTEALASGTTTLIGGGTGPTTGTKATTCTPGKHHIEFMLGATDGIAVNIGLTGKGNSSSEVGLAEQVLAGAVGLKLHEDWGSSPQAIDTCLRVCEEYDVQCTIHTDTLNETGFIESTIAAFKGRTIHKAYHIEGAGGGHAPDCLTMCSLPNVIPSSTNPTRPFTSNTLDEHLDMLMVCHHLSRDIPEDVAFAESRIRGETIGAEDYLHDIGAISIISSDSQAMGRVGEVVQRTWQTCHKNKADHLANPSPETAFHDNIRRYVSKYTINPAIAHGISGVVGSVEVGKLADLVMYKPEYFGTRPEIVIKGGVIVYAQMGDANASIPTTQPVCMQPMFGSKAETTGMTSIVFVSKASVDCGSVAKLGLSKKVVAVEGCRVIGKKDMKWNDACPSVEVDPETYVVTVGGRVLDVKPAVTLPLSQSVFLF